MPKLNTFGEKDGLPLVSATLSDGNSQVTILSLGAITQDWRHHALPVVLGYENPLAYLTDPYWFGAIAGRVANRIAYGRFTLNGREYRMPINHPHHHIHGGPEGMQQWNFALETDAAANTVILTHHSPDGHMGYPGAVDFTIRITLIGDRLTYAMDAQPDRPTPINLAQHSYYNLTGDATCRDHILWVQSAAHTPLDAVGIPTGQISDSPGTRFDFTTPHALAGVDPMDNGFDINMVLDTPRDVNVPVATVTAGTRQLTLRTDQPGLQIYDTMHLEHAMGGHDGREYQRFAGLCLEPQAFPGALDNPHFGSIIATPDKPYRQLTSVEITSI